MSKKSFRDNPALQFVSRPEIGKSEKERNGEVREVKEVTENFRSSPALFEAKSKRFNMLIRPSVFMDLKEMSEIRGTSINDLMHTIVENYIENHGKN